MPSRYASSPAAPSDAAERPYHCPTCHRSIPGGNRVPASGIEPDLVSLVSANTPGWEPRLGLCRDCARRFATALESLRRHAVSADAMPILPTPLRIGAPDEYRGRGVTIAFLDSGFFAHPDLVEPQPGLHQLSLAAHEPLEPEHVRNTLAQLAGLTHVTVEVNPCREDH